MTFPLDTDVHCHLLPGVDEGSRSLEESLLMAATLAGLGVRRVHVTPHQFRFGLSWHRQEIERRLADLRAAFQRSGSPLRLEIGAEHLYGEALLAALDSGDDLITSPSPWPEVSEPMLLVELPLHDPVVGVERIGERVRALGIRPVMAHPERTDGVQEDPNRVFDWRRAGWSFQVDLLSLAGTYGRKPQRVAEGLLGSGAYDCAGSDLHRSSQLGALERAHAAARRILGLPVAAETPGPGPAGPAAHAPPQPWRPH